MNTLPDVLKKLRTTKGLSQDELSVQLGISRSSVSMYERGEREPDITTMNKITDFYNVTVDFLLGNTDMVICPVCGFGDNPLNEYSRKEHEERHKNYLNLKEKYPFLMNSQDANKFYDINNKNIYGHGYEYIKQIPTNDIVKYIDNMIKAQFSLECSGRQFLNITDYDSFVKNEIISLLSEFNYFTDEQINAIKTNYSEILGDYHKKNSISTNNLNSRDKKDIAKDLDNIMNKLQSGEDGPATFDGQELSPESAELFKIQLESMLTQLKVINKEKYNPYKNKK